MEVRSCANIVCGASSSIEWKKGWALRSGEFANLCIKCWSAYAQSIFCDVFHSQESGWRKCALCGKRLHCGCIASKHLFELLDSGGVKCKRCAHNAEPKPISCDEKPDGLGGAPKIIDLQSTATENQLDGNNVENLTLMQLGNNKDCNGIRNLLQLQNNDTNGLLRKLKHDDVPPPMVQTGGTCLSNFNRASNGAFENPKVEVFKANLGINDLYESLPHTNLSMTLGAPVGKANPFPGAIVDEREHSKTSSPLLPGTRSRHLVPKPPKLALAPGLEENATMASPSRVARPPAEGRGRNQLLPRYWPRITDQELQQISGDSNSTIVPLFEKMLSASDAGRIGRLVLPKACAEAYFPPISQPEGLPLRIQDVKGKEWVFQFRFWPNNNSRMYVLEGVTPCIQSMQLQAGDTVTFSRMDPEGKLIMGFRKASNSVGMQDTHLIAIHNGSQSSETLFSGVFENLPVISGYPGLLQSLKGSMDPHLNALSKHMTTASSDISWLKPENPEGRAREGLLLPIVPEKKKTRNIGSKSKRLLIDSQDALELKLTWEEAQDLLRPPPAVKPSTIMIEDLEFEEYEEPPVFGKRSIFIVRSTGEQEQWAQCDNCSKWRRLPIDALLPSKWRCAENSWDQSRSSCSAPDQLTPRELETFLKLSKEFKKRRIAAEQRPTQEHESSGLDALANAAILGDNPADPGTASVATTTKHPRHRPGCSCIVCIQPPSGKGKHKPTCTCNVCMTVKRRFKTMMINKKKRQSEREAEIAYKNQPTWGPKDEAEADSSYMHVSPHVDPSDNEARSANESESKSQSKLAETGKGKLDLNCHPGREGDLQAGPDHLSMMSLVQVASLPLETYLKHNGLTSLASEQQASSTSHVPPQAANETEEQPDENHCRERESEGEDKPNQSQEDPL